MGGMGGTLLLSVRRHAYQNGVSSSVQEKLAHLKFVFFQIESYNYITRLGVESTKKNP